MFLKMFTSHFFKTLLLKKLHKMFLASSCFIGLKNALSAIFRSTKLDRLSGCIFIWYRHCILHWDTRDATGRGTNKNEEGSRNTWIQLSNDAMRQKEATERSLA